MTNGLIVATAVLSSRGAHMTDPAQAALWLGVAAVTDLVLCLGGTFIAVGLWRRPAPRGDSPHDQDTVR